MSAINAALPGWTTAAQARHTLTIARAPGTTPDRVAVALCVALLSPALPGALPGIPTGPAWIRARDRAARILTGESA